ncbi:hypothetical protein OE181_25780, partial [Escherichia coli]|uniref:hypothetical protein n=1 Tax=Escherichia coli TaxID=562 RepID=UPI0021F2BBCC
PQITPEYEGVRERTIAAGHKNRWPPVSLVVRLIKEAHHGHVSLEYGFNTELLVVLTLNAPREFLPVLVRGDDVTFLVVPAA